MIKSEILKCGLHFAGYNQYENDSQNQGEERNRFPFARALLHLAAAQHVTEESLRQRSERNRLLVNATVLLKHGRQGRDEY